jgi:hypothetical protein
MSSNLIACVICNFGLDLKYSHLFPLTAQLCHCLRLRQALAQNEIFTVWHGKSDVMRDKPVDILKIQEYCVTKV